MGWAVKYFSTNYWAMKCLALWFPGLRTIFWKISKTFRPLPPSDILNVRSLIENLDACEIQRKVIFEEIFWKVQDEGQLHIFHKSICCFVAAATPSLITPRILESLAGCLTESRTSDFYWILLSFRLPLIF